MESRDYSSAFSLSLIPPKGGEREEGRENEGTNGLMEHRNGLECWREGQKEGGREGGTEGLREGSRQGGTPRERGREGGRKAGRRRQAVREAGRQGGRLGPLGGMLAGSGRLLLVKVYYVRFQV